MEILCPHCNKKIEEPQLDKAQLNAEYYENRTFAFQCHLCKKVYIASFHREAVLEWVTKSTKGPKDIDVFI